MRTDDLRRARRDGPRSPCPGARAGGGPEGPPPPPPGGSCPAAPAAGRALTRTSGIGLRPTLPVASGSRDQGGLWGSGRSVISRRQNGWGQISGGVGHPPEREVAHPLGCHRPRIPDRIVFDKLIQVLVLGAAYPTIADSTCSATTIRARRDEWIAAGVIEAPEQLCLQAYDRVVGLDLAHLTVDGCITKAPCGGEAAGKSPVDRGKQGTKRSVLTEATGIPLGCVAAPANRPDSPLLRPTLGEAEPVRGGPGVRASRGHHRPPRRRVRQRQDPRAAR